MRLSMKRMIAHMLVCSMTLVSVIGINGSVSEAAGPTIAKSVSIIVGKSKTLNISNHNYMMLRITPKSSNKKIATCSNRNTNVYIRAKKVGKATITTRIRATKNKKTKTYKLKTKVTVKPVSYDNVKITDFAKIDSRLATIQSHGGGTLTIQSSQSVSHTFKKSYSKVKLVVYAPNATIKNKSRFKSVLIGSLSEGGWTEYTSGNTFTLSSTVPTVLNIDPEASVSTVKCAGTVSTAEQTVIVHGSLTTANITGNAPVRIEAPADPSKISLIKVDRLGAHVDIDVNIGATLKQVDVKKACDVTMTGNSTSAIKVNKVKEANVKISNTLTGVVVSVVN